MKKSNDKSLSQSHLFEVDSISKTKHSAEDKSSKKSKSTKADYSRLGMNGDMESMRNYIANIRGNKL